MKVYAKFVEEKSVIGEPRYFVGIGNHLMPFNNHLNKDTNRTEAITYWLKYNNPELK